VAYRPIEIPADIFDELHENPATRRFVSFRKGQRAPGVDVDYDGLRVKVALLRDPSYDVKSSPTINGSTTAAYIARSLADDVQENFLVLLLNSRNKVLGVYEAARGSVAGVEVHPQDVFRAALVAGARAIIVIHNHPSGEADPSDDDHALTKRLQKAGEVLGVSVLDHIILGDDSYVSFADRGWM
jgi:DNA repair protein RadC